MKNIEFRTWDKESELLGNVSGIYFEEDTILFTRYDLGIIKKLPFEQVDMMSWIGFYDNKREKVFEGDIVNISWFVAKTDSGTLSVYEDSEEASYVLLEKINGCVGFYWDEVDSFIPLSRINIDSETFEILGNKYENPELLKGEDEKH